MITGVQGTGKTYLAESPVADMEKTKGELKKLWILSVS